MVRMVWCSPRTLFLLVLAFAAVGAIAAEALTIDEFCSGMSFTPPELKSAALGNYVFGATSSKSCVVGVNDKAVATTVTIFATITGAYSAGVATETIVATVNGTNVQDGTYTLKGQATCKVDPWLSPGAAQCSLATWTGGGSKVLLATLAKTPFPLTGKSLPAGKAQELYAGQVVLAIVAPKSYSTFGYGADVPVSVEVNNPAALAGAPTVTVRVTATSSGMQSGWPVAVTGSLWAAKSAKVILPGKQLVNAKKWEVTARLDWPGALVSIPVQILIADKTPVTSHNPQTPLVAKPVPPPVGSQGSSGGGAGQAGPGQVGQARTQPQARAVLRHEPLRLVTAQAQGAAVLVVLANPGGNEDKPALPVELRMGRQVVGKGQLGALRGGGEDRLLVRYGLPPGTRAPVELEVWVGGARLGAVRVAPTGQAR